MKVFLYIVLFLMAAGCASHDGYVITGKVPEGWEGKAVELVVADVNKPYRVDSTSISGGEFRLKGKFDLSRYCIVLIYLDPERRDRNLMYQCPVFVDSTAIRITCDYSGKEPDFRVEGASAAHAQYQEYLDAYSKLADELGNSRVFKEYQNAQYRENDKAKGIELAGKLTEIRNQLRSFRLQYIKDHADSPVSLYIAKGLCGKQSVFSREEIEQIWAGFPSQLQNSEPGQSLYETLQQKKLFLGQPFLDMELMTPEGKTKKISEYVVPGHYTLLEFWASWCMPCRGEIPNMTEAYRKYHPKGFDIISVSIDQDAEAWKKAMAEEKMPWIQLHDTNVRKSPEKSAFKVYEGSGVPYSIMIDDQGKIIHLDARGGWLNLLLHEKYD